MAKKKNPYVGRSLDEFIEEQRVKDPEFRAEFDRLQLARTLKELREKKKMSQGKLAELAGTKQPNIARLESGKVIPKLDFLEKVARALGGRLDVRIVEGKSQA
ncbi:MAG TPA: helix-turn-helix transcriptional regulator [Myxococcales bacterium]|jgi:ribosome-binding protein aMBF1 (putative translation factor)|nr:helix-turn-helix transcriptional regulator [Myxococcales bacterium]